MGAGKLEKALEQRDIEWQEHLAYLHEGFSGDGCESGDPRDWTAAAISMRINRMQDRIDELEEDRARESNS